ncbi:MAG TPA: toll/interleukin-1 receptor domain-containing protein [Steroidobacteraceae bacterium]|nr:toll/interleukin-1 receptor domain-containing protein [Steroidobacteraceae bacterium]
MKAFVSYSHASENRADSHRWREHLLESLKAFADNGFVEAWDDEQIPAGVRWQREIENAIQTCRVAVILLTPETLRSDYILNNELPALERRETAKELIVIPALCEPCDWEEHEWLASLQIKPRDNRALSTLSRSDAQRSLGRICDEIAAALRDDLQWVISPVRDPRLGSDPNAPVSPQVYSHSALLPRALRLPAPLVGRERELAMLDLALKLPGASILAH